jgi:signal transduction histidine kinase
MIDELQAPLRTVLKLSETLLKENGDISLHKKQLKLIYHSAKNLENIIDDVAEISSLNNNNISVELTKVNLRDLLSQNFEIFRYKAREKSLRYSIRFGKELPKFIETDHSRLSQVISNLLSNAIKFTPKEGSVKFEIIFDKTNSTLKAYVDDNGLGIPESKKDQIFKPFKRDSDESKIDDSRTGLGLLISLSIIELLNGKISFESTENKGSTFSFEIPVKTYDE